MPPNRESGQQTLTCGSIGKGGGGGGKATFRDNRDSRFAGSDESRIEEKNPIGLEFLKRSILTTGCCL